MPPHEGCAGERNGIADTKLAGKPPMFAHGDMKQFSSWELSVMLHLIAAHRRNIRAAEVMSCARNKKFPSLKRSLGEN